MMLGFRADDLDPEEVTTTLKLTPTVAFRRGDVFLAGGRSHRRAYGVWMISTEASVSSEELADHCKRLLEWMIPVETQLKGYLAREGLRVAVGYWWEPTDGPIGFTFPAAEMRRLAEMCHELDFYFA